MFLVTINIAVKRSFSSHPYSLKVFSAILMNYSELICEIVFHAESEELKMQTNENLRLNLSAVRDPYSSFHSHGRK